jgi:serine/threonine protein kinase
MPAEKPPDGKGYLLRLAMDAIAPLVGGCAGVLAGVGVGLVAGPAAGGAAAVAAGGAVNRAIDYFGPDIASRWFGWLRGRPPAEQEARVCELEAMPPAAILETARRELQKSAPRASAKDIERAAEYLSAIPAAVRRSMVRSRDGTKSLSRAVSLAAPDLLLQLLPTDAPPYQIGSDVRTADGGTFRLEELIGTGGFGAVYRARMAGMQHLPVAVKFCLDPALVGTLRKEKEALDRLRSNAAWAKSWPASIVRLYGFNLAHETPFLVYEYVPGGDLGSQMLAAHQKGGWKPDFVLKVMRKVADALALAHAQGIVHRDIKPANVLVGEGNVLKLADFGIGAAVPHPQSGNKSVSASQAASRYRGAGTPLYMSPEQRRGEAADPRQDVYSLGVMWYQLLVGDVSRELEHGWEDELAERGVPMEQVALIKRCVGRLAGRPNDGGELSELIVGLAKGEDERTAVPPVPPVPPVPKQERIVPDATTAEAVEALRALRGTPPSKRLRNAIAEFDPSVKPDSWNAMNGAPVSLLRASAIVLLFGLFCFLVGIVMRFRFARESPGYFLVALASFGTFCAFLARFGGRVSGRGHLRDVIRLISSMAVLLFGLFCFLVGILAEFRTYNPVLFLLASNDNPVYYLAVLASFGMFVAFSVGYGSQTHTRRHLLDVIRRYIVATSPRLVAQFGGPGVLRTDDGVIEVILRLQGFDEAFVAGFRERKQVIVAVHSGHVVEVVEGSDGKLGSYYDGKKMTLSFHVEEEGEPAFYEADPRKPEIVRNGRKLEAV